MVKGSNAHEGRIDDIFASLRQHGAYIEHKFNVGRQYDITAEDIKEILSEITELVNNYPEEESSSIDAIKDLAASAISLYYEAANRPFFFNQVERIGDLLVQL